MQPLDFSLDVNDFPQQTSDFETTTETKVQEDHDSSGADQKLKKQ